MSNNPYLNRANSGGSSPHGKKYEKRVAVKLGARLTPNSGAIRGAKSDATLKDFRLEMKSTIHKTLPLSLEWLVKITHEAQCHNQRPAVVFCFATPEGKPVMKTYSEWVCIPRSVFQELVEGV